MQGLGQDEPSPLRSCTPYPDSLPLCPCLRTLALDCATRGIATDFRNCRGVVTDLVCTTLEPLKPVEAMSQSQGSVTSHRARVPCIPGSTLPTLSTEIPSGLSLGRINDSIPDCTTAEKPQHRNIVTKRCPSRALHFESNYLPRAVCQLSTCHLHTGSARLLSPSPVSPSQAS